ncbi:Pkinase-domain-containing protein [Dissoconium aciculare CBS 342.82]|uniref:non-specific serine/threonine protein kinase n=1 Tax=Dissoconium aciculare CBS 342.82 TaxID=1314786 RepID=A0A6J3LZF5_9PEZI|nr:Pkinase-domain-containing protein [Dissoconium aciculare CBS 342.82]KAF1821160.1 Pkinase-domain-containing protein [Dissoconium aciculare CBS 342.82]
MEETATQELTQQVLDPRRVGLNNSGLAAEDISDVMCILHPCTPASFMLVKETARRSPQHVLVESDAGKMDYQTSPDMGKTAMDLALRFSSVTIQPSVGFVFGRADQVCDIVISSGAHKRVSNRHFCIYINTGGVLMLQDMSTNGTMVDWKLLKHRADTTEPQRHMLNNGSIIQILSPVQSEILKFIVRIPSRETCDEEYTYKFNQYMNRIAAAQAAAHGKAPGTAPRNPGDPVPMEVSNLRPLTKNAHGMHWSGGTKYNVVGTVGKGAFATVYQVATKSDGTLYAAKELEKRQFVKNGILDRKLDNEMNIMRSVQHANVVRYIDYHDVANHLYIIMEYVQYGDLQQYLMGRPGEPCPGQPLPENMARQMAGQVLSALHYLHEQMITHRDIKPDNILIADPRPDHFTVKLSDFGLSKVVKDENTFLRTFCGTLLYCAPEVFPHYNAHIARQGTKRPRNSQQRLSRRYSKAVDIWSFGAVLWFALCLHPPFEGVADSDGRGMFQRITTTSLNISDLVMSSVSNQAISLLIEMINVDPIARPTPAECLHRAWFGRAFPIPAPSQSDLDDIEEDEAEVEPDMSQLSIIEPHPRDLAEVSMDSSDFDFFQQSKRFKSEAVDYGDQQSGIRSDGSDELYPDESIVAPSSGAIALAQHAQVKPPKLFGEISQSNLTAAATGVKANATSLEAKSADKHLATSDEHEQHDIISSPSLLGTEEMVRDFNMDTPMENRSRKDESIPSTPSRPTQAHQNHESNDTPASHIDVTPKPAPVPFRRRINLPVTAPCYWDPADKSTHNDEYASKVSGFDFTTQKEYYLAEGQTLASTIHGSAAVSKASSVGTSNTSSSGDMQTTTAIAPVDSPQTQKPTTYGRLVPTPDSCMTTPLEIHDRMMSFGRFPSMTYVYPDETDARVPKHAITVYFNSPHITDDNTMEWMNLPDLYAGVVTHASAGVWVNGVHLARNTGGSEKRPLTAHLHTGDEITIFSGHGHGSGMKFTCEFFIGAGKNVRKAEDWPCRVEEIAHRTRSR